MACRLLTALAATTLSGAALAQSSVTIYGVVDLGVQVNSPDRAGAESVTSIASGIRNSSRLGFRGTEDLGGGLSARFQLEQGINADVGTLGQGGRIFGRQSYVALEGSFGLVALGRLGTIGSSTGAFEIVSPLDPFAMSYGLASVASTFSESGSLRVDNALLYQSKNYSGFQIVGLHSLQANGAEVETSENTRVDSVGASFGQGPFLAVVTYFVGKFPESTGFENQKLLQVGATYDLRVIKLYGMFAQEDNVRSALISAIGTAAAGTDAKAWMVGATVPFGPLSSKFMASYQVRDGKQQTVGTASFDADRKVYSIGYEYWLSKRTYLSAMYADSSGSGSLQVGTAANDFANVKQYAVALTHRF